MKSKEKNIFSHTLNARIDDINYGKHVCHTKYLNMLHHVRTLFLNANHLSEENCFGHALVVTNLNVNYLSQCFFNDLLEVVITSFELDKATIKIAYRIFNHTKGTPAIQADMSMGLIDMASGKLKRPSQELVQFIANLSKNG